MQRRLGQVGAPVGGWEEDAGALLQGMMALDAPPCQGPLRAGHSTQRPRPDLQHTDPQE